MRRLVVAGAMSLMVFPLIAGDVAVGYLGHSCFTIQGETGPIVLIDPYATYVPYPALPKPADVVLVTHGHIDHCPYCFGESNRVLGNPIVVWPFDKSNRVREGTWRITEELTVRFVEATHVTVDGGGEGLVCLFVFTLGGVRFAHLGDLGRTLTDAQAAALAGVQVMFVPVGGAYTLNAAEAIQVVKQLPSVRVVVPMHYFVAGYCPWPAMAGVDAFLGLAKAEGWEVRDLETAEVAMSQESLPANREVWVMPLPTD